MGTELSGEMIARLKDRAGDPKRRSDTEEMMANSRGLDDLLGARRDEIAAQPADLQQGIRGYLEGMNSPFSGMIANSVFGDSKQAKGLLGALGSLLGGKPMFATEPGGIVSLGRRRKPRKAPSSATEAAVAVAEKAIGFELPAGLRQFYLEIADGGVGPGDGLYSLRELVAKWRAFVNEPIGPRGQKWPARLLPIHGDGWDVIAIDRDTGALVYWDVEEIDYGGWEKSFKQEASSLEDWLNKWLSQPSLEEKAKRRAERPAPRQLTDEDWDVWAQESPAHQEYMRRLNVVSMTPEERRAIGLPDVGWEAHIWDGFDLTALKFPTPGYAERKRDRNGGKDDKA